LFRGIPLGTAAAPSIAIEGDENTGIYSPGADQVAISTNGGGRLFIDSSGRVNIGTTSEPRRLHVSNGYSAATSLDGSLVQLISNNGSTGDYAGLGILGGNTGGSFIHFGDTDDAGVGRIGYFHSDNSFRINTNGGERLRLTSTGALNFVGAGSAGSTQAVSFNGSAPVNSLVIDSSGRVGLGTGSPEAPLSIKAENSDALTLNFSNSAVVPAFRLINGLGTAAGCVDGWKINYRPSYASGSGSGADKTAIQLINTHSRNDADLALLPSGGRVGIGNTAPGNINSNTDDLVIGAGSSDRGITLYTGSTSAGYLAFTDTGDTTNQGWFGYSHTDNALLFGANSSERARIDSSGRLLVGTSSSRTVHGDHTPQIQLEGTTYQGSTLSIINNGNNEFGAYIFLGKARGGSIGSNTIVNNGDSLGQIRFSGSDGVGDFSVGALVEAKVDGTPGSGDLPTRLEFSTTADGASSPTERMRINSVGSIKQQGASSSLESATGDFNEVNIHNTVTTVLLQRATNSSFASSVSVLKAVRAASSSYNFLVADSDSSGSSDTEFKLRGDGQAYADGSWNGGGADYAEYFEWSDGNPDEDDRRGISVVLDGNQIRPAEDGEDPIGVISGNPSVVGDAAWNKWSGKYLRDDYGTYILEDYEVVNDEGETVIQQRRKLNPAYDPDQEYVNREDRPEWDCVGLMGKLRIRKDQPTGSRWIKMRDISDSVEEWLVR
jgi:hypothetical protein